MAQPAAADPVILQPTDTVDSSSPQVPLTSFKDKLSQGPNFTEFLSGEAIGAYSVEAMPWQQKQRKPDWMKRNILPGGDKYTQIKAKLREFKLNTVCEEAKCPNIGECWGGGQPHSHSHHHAHGGHLHQRLPLLCSQDQQGTPSPGP